MQQADPRVYMVGNIFTPSTPVDKMDLFKVYPAACRVGFPWRRVV